MAQAGYEFDGWNVTAANGLWAVNDEYLGGTNITAGMYGDVTLTAQWTENQAMIKYYVTDT